MQPAWGLPLSTDRTNGGPSSPTTGSAGHRGVAAGPRQEPQPPNKTFSYLQRPPAHRGDHVGQRRLAGTSRDQALRQPAAGRQTQKPEPRHGRAPSSPTPTTTRPAGRCRRTTPTWPTSRRAPTLPAHGHHPVAVVTTTTGPDGDRRDPQGDAPPASPGGEKWPHHHGLRRRPHRHHPAHRRHPPPPSSTRSAARPSAATTTQVSPPAVRRLRHHDVQIRRQRPDDRGRDATGNKWTYEYDLRGPPEPTTRTRAHHLRLRRRRSALSTTDARGKTLAYTYDTLGRKTSMRDGGDRAMRAEWIYDTLSTAPRSRASWSRPSLRGAASTSRSTSATPPTTSRRRQVHDPRGRDRAGGTYDYVYTYNQDGSLATTRLPAVGDLRRRPWHGYNAPGQPTTLKSRYGTRRRRTS